MERNGEPVDVAVKLGTHRPGETAVVGYAGILPEGNFKQPGVLKALVLTPAREIQIGKESIVKAM